MSVYRIGSRESRLAVIQSEMVKKYLESKGMEAQIVTMKTTGDIILDQTLDQAGGKGLFVKELDMALRDGRSDLSVHSLKDVPVIVPDDLPLIGFLKREDPRDVLVLPWGADNLDPKKPIGCSSRRRVLQAKKIYPHMEFKSIRGNVNTRLQKLDNGEYSALILAAAGLKRLGMENRISRYFTEEEMVPSAGQGILALQGTKSMDYSILHELLNEDAKAAAVCERAFVRYVDGDCTSPIGAYAKITGDQIELSAMYCSRDGKKDFVVGKIVGAKENPEQLSRRLAIQLREQYEQIGEK